MASIFAKRLLVLIVSGMLMSATGAEAHPHVWVSVKTTVLFKGGAIVGLQQHWTFDEFYAAMAIEGLDKNNDGVYDRQELAPLAQVNMDGMKEFKYFTFAKLGDAAVELSPPTDYWLEYTNKLLTLHFTLPLAKAVPAKANGLSFSTYDSSFFIAFELAEKDPIALRGKVHSGCKAIVAKDEDEADTKRLGDAFKQQFGGANFGGNLGQRVGIDCPN
jgi:ABC-type uncharacterized transport system substrate-binding protein